MYPCTIQLDLMSQWRVRAIRTGHYLYSPSSISDTTPLDLSPKSPQHDPPWITNYIGLNSCLNDIDRATDAAGRVSFDTEMSDSRPGCITTSKPHQHLAQD